MKSAKSPPRRNSGKAKAARPSGVGSATTSSRASSAVRCSEAMQALLRLQVVREVREVLGAVLCHDDEIFEAAASVARAVQPRLERDDVARQQLAGPASSERRGFVHLAADSLREAVEEPAVEQGSGLLGVARRLSVLLEEIADQVVDLHAGHARLRRFE